MINTPFDKFIYLSECNSTNEYAIEYLSKSKPSHNIAIYTFNQSAGRGQIGRSWYTGEGKNLAVSFLLNLESFKAKDGILINLWFAYTVHAYLCQLLDSENIYIKWPNDIYVGNEKIAGILIQSNIQGSEINNCTLGLGINFNEDQFPHELPNPISYYQLTGKRIDLSKQLLSLCSFVEKQFRFLKSEHLIKIKSYYQDNLYLLNQLNEFTLVESNDKFLAKAIGINENGEILLETEKEVLNFKFREIRY